MEIENVVCDLCGCNEYTVVWEKKDDDTNKRVIKDENGKIVNGRNNMCNKCGLVYVSPRMTEAELNKFYEAEYRKTYGTDMSGELKHANGVVAFIREWIDLSNLNNDKSLDIGCCNGILVYALSQLGFDAYGIDTDHEIIEAQKKTGLKLIDTTLADCTEKDFSLITIVNTLEHMYSPKASLLKIRSMMKDDGVLVVVVPDLYTPLLLCDVNGFLSNAHLYTFESYTLVQMMSSAGLDIKKLAYSIEPNFSKIYCIAKKSETEPVVEFNLKPNPEDLIKRFNYLNEIYHMSFNRGKEAKDCQKSS